MNYSIILVGFLLLATTYCAPISSNKCAKEDVHGKPSYLWHISSTFSNKTSYLFGTLNIPFDTVQPWLPHNALDALNAADEVVPEVNLFDKTSEATVKDCQFLPENKTLQDVIDAGLFEKVDNHLKLVEKSIHKWIPNISNKTYAEKIGASLFRTWVNGLYRKKPQFVAGVIEILDPVLVRNRIRVINNLVYYALSMNDYMMALGNIKNKIVKALASGSETCDRVNTLTDEQAQNELEDAVKKWEDILTRKELEHTETKDQEFADYTCLNISEKKEAIEKQWAVDKMDRLLQDNSDTSFLFTFNIYEFFGKKSVVQALKQKGYKVERQTSL